MGDDHHFRGPHPKGEREQRSLSFATETLVFWSWRPWSLFRRLVGLGCNCRFGNKLTAIALVDTCFTMSIDLKLIVVVDTGT
jgi:hypothetical protein